MTKAELAKILEEVHENEWYEYIGVRTQDEAFEAEGQPVEHESKIWVDGEETDEALGGLCVTHWASPMIAAHCEDAGDAQYIGAHLAIIVGDHATYGEDEGEIIITDPIVYRVLR